MAQDRTKRQEQEPYFKGISKKEYIQKTYELIRRDGIGKVSIRRLADELGCSSANLYHHFSSLQELLFYSECRTLRVYIDSISEAEKNWRGVRDIYIGIWDCYSLVSFQYPEAWDIIFFRYDSEQMRTLFHDYYSMFEEDLMVTSSYFVEMLEEPGYMERDMKMCQMCVKAGILTEENAILLNRQTCMLYKGYLKTILDTEPAEERKKELRKQFMEDISSIFYTLIHD